MSGRLLALLLALGAGVAMAVQGSLNSALGKVIGLLEATLVVHFTAALAVAVMLFALGLGDGSWERLGEAPWYVYLGGLVGVAITYGVVASIPKVGVAAATTAIIIGQVTMAMLVDQFGLFGLPKVGFDWWKALGLVLLAGGAWLMLE